MTIESTRTARLNMRIAPSALALVREAAAHQQQDLTSFVLSAAVDRARKVLLEENVLQLSPAASEQILRVLADEPTVIPELAELARKVAG